MLKWEWREWTLSGEMESLNGTTVLGGGVLIDTVVRVPTVGTFCYSRSCTLYSTVPCSTYCELHFQSANLQSNHPCTLHNAQCRPYKMTMNPATLTHDGCEPRTAAVTVGLYCTSGDEPTIVQCCEAWFHYMGLVWGRHIIHIGPQEVTVYTGLWLMCMYTLYSPLSLVLYVQIHTYTPPTHHTQSHNRHMTHTHIWIGFMAEFLFRVAFSHRQAVQYIQYCQLSCTNRQQSLAFPEQCN